jgi:hypothetical protein
MINDPKRDHQASMTEAAIASLTAALQVISVWIENH